MMKMNRKPYPGKEKFFVLLCSAIFVLLSVLNSADATEVQIRDAGQPPSSGASRAPALGRKSFFAVLGFQDARTQAGIKEAGIKIAGPDGTKTVNMQNGTWWSFNGKYTLTVNASGYESVSYSLDTAQWTTNKSITFRLSPANQGLLIIIVRDEVTKQGIGNASVTISGPGGSRSASTTSAQPTVAFQNIPYGSYQIAVTAPGYLVANSGAQVTSPAQTQATVWMNRGQGKVAFNVMAQWSGNPVSGASVTVTGPSGTSTANTDSKGIAAFTVPAGKISMTIKAAGFMDLRQENITVPTSNNVNIYTLARLMGVIHVTVRDVNNRPLKGAYVRAWKGNDLQYAGITDGNGNASINIKQGTYGISVSLSGYKVKSAGEFTLSNQPISVTVNLSR